MKPILEWRSWNDVKEAQRELKDASKRLKNPKKLFLSLVINFPIVRSVLPEKVKQKYRRKDND